MGVDVNAGVHVVHQVPSGVVRVIVNDEVIAGAIPAPARGQVPIPVSDDERESAGKPEAMCSGVETVHMIAVGRAEMFEASVLVGMSDDIAFVVGRIVTVPMVVGDVRNTVNASARAAVHFRLGVRVPFGWCRLRNVALIGVDIVMVFFAALLREGGRSHQRSYE